MTWNVLNHRDSKVLNGKGDATAASFWWNFLPKKWPPRPSQYCRRILLHWTGCIRPLCSHCSIDSNWCIQTRWSGDSSYWKTDRRMNELMMMVTFLLCSYPSLPSQFRFQISRIVFSIIEKITWEQGERERAIVPRKVLLLSLSRSFFLCWTLKCIT